MGPHSWCENYLELGVRISKLEQAGSYPDQISVTLSAQPTSLFLLYKHRTHTHTHTHTRTHHNTHAHSHTVTFLVSRSYYPQTQTLTPSHFLLSPSVFLFFLSHSLSLSNTPTRTHARTHAHTLSLLASFTRLSSSQL